MLIGLYLRELESREKLTDEELEGRARRVMDEAVEALEAAREAIQQTRRGEPVDCGDRRGKAWEDIRALVAMRVGADDRA
jgi:hypothetical protein